MDQDELQLNSVSRFSKQSVLLHLEEHGHCEVPAGCGGVVLRWYNPAAGLPLLLRVFSPGKIRLFIDGTPPASARPLVAPGWHILALEVDDAISDRGVIMFAATCDRKAGPGITEEQRVAAVSAPDGSWFCNTTPPGDDAWRLSDDDLAGWEPMVECPIDVPDRKGAWRSWHSFEELTKMGARPLGLPAGRDRAAASGFRKTPQRFGSPFGTRIPVDHTQAIRIRRAFHVSMGGRP